MLITADYLSLSSSACFFKIRESNFNIGLNFRRRRVCGRCCKASLITNSDSFEVGRLIGSYGFMNVTRFELFLKILVCLFFCAGALVSCEI